MDVGADEAVDSDADSYGQTDVLFLTLGENRTDVDAGLVPPAPPGGSTGTIGDFVWEDTDRDGVQDVGEPGLAGVVVRLLDSIGNVVGTTTTDGTGRYQFGGLGAGTYSLEFVAPTGYGFSPQDRTDDAFDNDAGPMTGRTQPFTLNPGQVKNTVDAGLSRSSGSGGSGGYPGYPGLAAWEDTESSTEGQAEPVAATSSGEQVVAEETRDISADEPAAAEGALVFGLFPAVEPSSDSLADGSVRTGPDSIGGTAESDSPAAVLPGPGAAPLTGEETEGTAQGGGFIADVDALDPFDSPVWEGVFVG